MNKSDHITDTPLWTNSWQTNKYVQSSYYFV